MDTFSFDLEPGMPPLSCRIRDSERARTLRLTVKPDGTVEIVLPPGRSLESARSFLMNQRDWLRRTLAKVQRREKHLRQTGPGTFPLSLSLRFLRQICPVDYHWHDTVWTAAKWNTANSRVEFSGDVMDPEKIREVLASLLIRIAQKEFPARLRHWADITGIPFSRMTVRLQKGRWGSCSGRGNISLNAFLLFFDPELVDYVMIHELCHRRHMDHSPAFWAEVKKWCPDCKECRNRINLQAASLPNRLFFPDSR